MQSEHWLRILLSLESLLGQTYQNQEIILVDDGSPDECPAICDAYASANKRIRVIHKANGGLSSAREAGIQNASGDFIVIVVGDTYEDAYWVAILMMIPNMIPLVQSICLNVVVAQNKHKFRSLVYLGIAILNVVGTWFLMRYMGIIGAALMTGVALIIGQGFVMNWYYHKKTGLDMLRFWKQMLSVYIVPTLLCIGTLLLSNWIDFYKLPALFTGIALYTVMYCGLNWLFTVNAYEKEMILGQMKRKRYKKI